MKDPSRSSTSPSIISEDVIINGHSHEDDNPFAEYMWMENEEEFNRQDGDSASQEGLIGDRRPCWSTLLGKSLSRCFVRGLNCLDSGLEHMVMSPYSPELCVLSTK
ncbi:polyadenylate-binding protein-interacting protein 2 isoform X2 [Pelecanus crispus]|uniref:polyadenylate-binding protein-interacting protein 2 isoform X2 n=1 Tax=Pelecanus crispus TaxID=36300 RepID=UPI003F5D023E